MRRFRWFLQRNNGLIFGVDFFANPDYIALLVQNGLF
jgi:hypothetical protein